VTLRARWVTLRARWVTLRARWVTLRARWVTLRARWVTLRARWVTLRARWVTLRARWVTLSARWVSRKVVMSANWVDPPKRERKKNYNESEYYRKAMSTGVTKTAGPRIPKVRIREIVLKINLKLAK
jgi:hypothetical protein